MSDNSVDVMDIVSLPKDDSDVHMFKVKVHYKDKDTVLSSDFWPEFVGCRHYFGEWTFLVRIQTQIMTNLLNIATLNCEGIKRSRDYINNYLYCSSCDTLCIQETWHLDENIDLFSTISSEYVYIAKSGVDSGARILPGRPKGGVGIFYKKSLSDKIIHVSSHSRRVSGIIINFTSNFLVYYCLSIYHMIIIALFMSIMNIQNVLVILSHCITQLTVEHLCVVEILIVLLIDRTHKLNF